MVFVILGAMLTPCAFYAQLRPNSLKDQPLDIVFIALFLGAVGLLAVSK